MLRKNIASLTLAALLGFLGGRVGSRTQGLQASSRQTIRATRFELVNEGGMPVAFWGVDEGQHIVLTFTGGSKHQLALFGINSSHAPFLLLNGSDGGMRAVLQLAPPEEQQKASLVMSGGIEGRMMLGFIPTDYPSPEDDDWALLFRNPRTREVQAGIGSHKDPVTHSPSGWVLTRNNKGKKWSAPN